MPVRGRALGAVVGIGTTKGVGGRIGADWARRTAAVAAFLWRVGCKMFRTSVICSRLMSGWSASNLLIKPWSTKSSRVLAAGALIPSWGTVAVAGTGRETSGMGKCGHVSTWGRLHSWRLRICRAWGCTCGTQRSCGQRLNAVTRHRLNKNQ